MERERYFNAVEFKDIKGIIYNSAKQYAKNTAFILKHKEDKKVTYENITYKKLLQDINAFGTQLYEYTKRILSSEIWMTDTYPFFRNKYLFMCSNTI